MHQISWNERKQELGKGRKKQRDVSVPLQFICFPQITFQIAYDLSRAEGTILTGTVGKEQGDTVLQT